MQPQRDVVRVRVDRGGQAVDDRIGTHKTSSLDGAADGGDTPVTRFAPIPRMPVRHRLPVVLASLPPVEVSRR
ncbi:hypothetical protein Pen02_14280 [Plantactinospora endophytica]|uniref:Uncharacterized protein n=1 Tax=Plantactinospora endophytica TaxID=673535 RepID=A0ABQ4DWM9_9ACTN|nr:hypothetical protein Pen02_14280 [Plantactinospora endophytica]